jgi:hypothetical protein
MTRHSKPHGPRIRGMSHGGKFTRRACQETRPKTHASAWLRVPRLGVPYALERAVASWATCPATNINLDPVATDLLLWGDAPHRRSVQSGRRAVRSRAANPTGFSTKPIWPPGNDVVAIPSPAASAVAQRVGKRESTMSNSRRMVRPMQTVKVFGVHDRVPTGDARRRRDYLRHLRLRLIVERLRCRWRRRPGLLLLQ